MVSRNVSALVFRKGAAGATPAFATRISTGPLRDVASATAPASAAGSPTSADACEMRIARGDHGFQRSGVPAEHRYPRTIRGQPGGDDTPDAPAPACDKRVLALKGHAASLICFKLKVSCRTAQDTLSSK